MKNLLLDPKLFLTLTLISLLLLLCDLIGLLNLPKSMLQTMTIPVQYGFYQYGKSIGKQWELIALARQSSRENKALKTQLSQLLSENAGLRTKLAETESLVDQYNKLSPRTYDLLPARPWQTGRFLIIDKGANEGVIVDQAVVFGDNYVGTVKLVSPESAKVSLPQDPDSKIAVYSRAEGGRAKGVLVGQFGSEMLMDKILHQEVISVGDLVYSEGIEGKLPKGLIVGRVSEVLERPNEIFKQAKVTPIFTLEDLDVVFVIRNP